MTRFNKIVRFGNPKNTVIIRFGVLIVYVWTNSLTYRIFVGRAVGLEFGDLKSHPRWRTWFGVCVRVVCQPGLDFMIRGFNVQLTVLVVTPTKKTLLIFSLHVLLWSKSGQGQVYGLISNSLFLLLIWPKRLFSYYCRTFLMCRPNVWLWFYGICGNTMI